jgi:3-methyladenine DNA glycosylase/8-oxoguanine DNA glycosylase
VTPSLTPRALRDGTAHVRRADPVIAAIVTEVGRCRLAVDARGSHFAALLESILYQQITGKAAASIHSRLCALVRRTQPRPSDILKASDTELRAVGLSRQKISYLRDLAGHVENGLPLARISRLPDEQVIEALTDIRGIGRWTAEMFLMFRLGRLDVLPVHDYGIRKAMQLAYRMRQLPKPDRMHRVAESWRPYRTIACWYLWRSLDAKGGRA